MLVCLLIKIMLLYACMVAYRLLYACIFVIICIYSLFVMHTEYSLHSFGEYDTHKGTARHLLTKGVIPCQSTQKHDDPSRFSSGLGTHGIIQPHQMFS